MKTSVLLTLLLALFSTAYSQTTNGLISSYLFENGSLNDGTGTNHATASMSGVVSSDDRFGNEDGAKLFDGKTTSYINLGNSSTLKSSTGTISLWVRVDGISSDGFGHTLNPIFTSKNGCTVNWWRWPAVSLWVNMDKSQYLGWGRPNDCSDPHFPAPSNEAPAFGNWQHLVLSYNDTEVRFYVDGQLNVVSPKVFPTVFSADDDFVLGNTQYPTSQRGFQGSIDDVLIYNRVLNDAEVLELYNAPNPNLTPVNAPIQGESPCAAKWYLSNPSSSSLQILGEGIRKVSYTGNSEVVSNELVANENGWMRFRVEDFGDKKPKVRADGTIKERSGRIKVGVKTGGDTYQFNLAGDKTKHWIFKNGQQMQSFQATFKEGADIRIKRTANRIVLKQKVNGKKETVARIKNVPAANTQFFVKMNGLGASIVNPKMSFTLGCPPYAVLKEKKDGGYIQQTDDVLRVKYTQEYAVDPVNEYLDLPYKIYDWQRSVVKSGNIRVRYGTNWKNINISTLAPDTYFTLEFEGNKEEQYTLRFKTK